MCFQTVTSIVPVKDRHINLSILNAIICYCLVEVTTHAT